MSSSNPQGLQHLLRSGGAPLMAIGLLGRLPTAMTPMLLLVAIPLAGGSLTQAGAGVGVSALGTALSGLAVGLLIDRFGARPVVVLAVIIQAIALLGVAAQFRNLDDASLLLPLAFLVGVSNPAIGALARAEWVRRSDAGELNPAAVRSAMAWEASSSEAAFVFGPVVASLLLSLIDPRTALIAVALSGVAVHLEFVRQVPLRAARSVGVTQRCLIRSFSSVFTAQFHQRPGVVAMAALLIATAVGLVFGSVQASLNAIFAGLGVPALVGPVYAIMGAGSIVGGLVWAQMPDRLRGPWVVLSAGVVFVCVGAVVVNSTALGIAASGVVCAVVGLWLSPVLAEAYHQGRVAVSARFKVTMMTVFAGGTSVGVGVGAPLASALSATGEAQSGFLGLAVAGVVFILGGGLLLVQARGRSQP